MRIQMLSVWLVVSFVLGFGLIGCAARPHLDKGPAAFSEEGLQRVVDSGFKQFAVRPGTDFSKFPEVRIDPLAISYSERPPTSAVYPRDRDFELNEIERQHFKKIFREVFEEELGSTGGKQVVVAATTEPTLVLRPQVSQLKMSAPIELSPQPNATFVQVSGEFSFEGVILDGTTGEVLARFSDTRDIGYREDMNEVKIYNSVVFWNDLRLILRSWARVLASRLSEPPLL